MNRNLYEIHEYLGKHLYVKKVVRSVCDDDILKQCKCGRLAWITVDKKIEDLDDSWDDTIDEYRRQKWHRKYNTKPIQRAVKNHYKLINDGIGGDDGV
jgi:hypothetical protein